MARSRNDAQEPPRGVTRRRVLQGIGVSAAAGVLTTARGAQRAAAAGRQRTTTELNGKWDFGLNGSSFPYQVDVPNFVVPVNWWVYKADTEFPGEVARISAYGYDVATVQADGGWYRKVVSIPSDWAGRRIELQFDGIAMQSKIWVNRQNSSEAPMKASKGMYRVHRLDITDRCTPGQSAEILVWVGSTRTTEDLGYTGSSEFPSSETATPPNPAKSLRYDNGPFLLSHPIGIWEGVRIVASDPIYVSDVYFKPRLDGADIEVTVVNTTSSAQNIRIRNKVAKVGETTLLINDISGGMSISVGATKKYTASVSGVSPDLWTPETPNLYNLTTSVEDANGLVDVTTTRVGFRTFAVQNGQFVLNGKPFWLRGAGQAPTFLVGLEHADLIKYWVQQIRGANVNLTRMHLGPASTAWYDTCDEVGLGVASEGVRPWVFNGYKTPCPVENDIWLDETQYVIRRLRNHPSILIWAGENEPQIVSTDTNVSTQQQSRQRLSAFVQTMRTWDSTRPVQAAGHLWKKNEVAANWSGLDMGDVDDFHSYPGWYEPSAFTYLTEAQYSTKATAGRPFISGELSTGYPNFHDNGRPFGQYLTPRAIAQTFVGHHADDSPATTFLATHAMLTKEIAESARRTRGATNPTAGTILFSTACWFENLTSLANISAFPVLKKVKEAYQPLWASLADNRLRHFYAGESVDTSIVVAHDAHDRGTFTTLKVRIDVVNAADHVMITPITVDVPSLALGKNVTIPVTIPMPALSGSTRTNGRLTLTVLEGSVERSKNSHDIVIAANGYVAAGTAGGASKVWVYDPGNSLSAALAKVGLTYTSKTTLAGLAPGNPDLLIVGRGGVDGTVIAANLLDYTDGGGRVVILEGGNAIEDLLPNDIFDIHSTLQLGEAVVASDEGTASGDLLAGMDTMDLRWWRNVDADNTTTATRLPYMLYSAVGTSGDLDGLAYLDLPVLSPNATNVKRLTEFVERHGNPPPSTKYPTFLKKKRPESTGAIIVSSLRTARTVPVDPLAGRYLANLLNLDPAVTLDGPQQGWTDFTDTHPFTESFPYAEHWTIAKGWPVIKSSKLIRGRSHDGIGGFGQIQASDNAENNKLVIYIVRRFTRAKVSLWLYDDASLSDTIMMARVDDHWETGHFRGMGVLQNSKYVVRIDGATTPTSITRSTGWHNLVWDYTSSSQLKMSIDGTQVWAGSGLTQFSTIALGDWWGNASQTGALSIDDIAVTDVQ